LELIIKTLLKKKMPRSPQNITERGARKKKSGARPAKEPEKRMREFAKRYGNQAKRKIRRQEDPRQERRVKKKSNYGNKELDLGIEK